MSKENTRTSRLKDIVPKQIKDMKDPFQRYTHEDIEKMSLEEYNILLEEHRVYFNEQWKKEKDTPLPHFDSVEDAISYYQSCSLDAVISKSLGMLESK